MSFSNPSPNTLTQIARSGPVTSTTKTWRFGGGGVEGTVVHHATWTGDSLPLELLKRAMDALRKTMLFMIDLARRYVPVDTERLKNSIRIEGIEARGASLVGRVVAGGIVLRGVLVDYAIWQEIGTRFNVGHFYMLRSGREAAPFFWAFMLQGAGGFGL